MESGIPIKRLEELYDIFWGQYKYEIELICQSRMTSGYEDVLFDVCMALRELIHEKAEKETGFIHPAVGQGSERDED